MSNYKTVPNQKAVVVHKEKCDKQHIYALINLEAMEQAAQNLDAGAFKLWCYFAKNQDGHDFALSSTDAANRFGLKKRQYNSAIEELIEKNYLINTGGNRYDFYEVAVVTKCNNEEEQEKLVVSKCNNAVITKCNNDVITKRNNVLLQNDTRNNTYNTYNNTMNNTTNFAAMPQNSTVEKIVVNHVPKATVKKKKPYVKPTITEVPLWMYELV